MQDTDSSDVEISDASCLRSVFFSAYGGASYQAGGVTTNVRFSI